MGLFADIKEAKGTEGGNYFEPGNYVVQIQKCKEGKTRSDKPFFAAECRIMESDNEEAKPGSLVSFFVLFDEYPELSLGNVADFMRAGLASYMVQNGIDDVPEDHNAIELDEATADEISGEENLLAGVYMNCFAFNKKTKGGNDFTRFKWTPIRKDQVEAIAAA
jgi:hypothetical protein